MDTPLRLFTLVMKRRRDTTNRKKKKNKMESLNVHDKRRTFQIENTLAIALTNGTARKIVISMRQQFDEMWSFVDALVNATYNWNRIQSYLLIRGAIQNH